MEVDGDDNPASALASDSAPLDTTRIFGDLIRTVRQGRQLHEMRQQPESSRDEERINKLADDFQKLLDGVLVQLGQYLYQRCWITFSTTLVQQQTSPVAGKYPPEIVECVDRLYRLIVAAGASPAPMIPVQLHPKHDLDEMAGLIRQHQHKCSPEPFTKQILTPLQVQRNNLLQRVLRATQTLRAQNDAAEAAVESLDKELQAALRRKRAIDAKAAQASTRPTSLQEQWDSVKSGVHRQTTQIRRECSDAIALWSKPPNTANDNDDLILLDECGQIQDGIDRAQMIVMSNDSETGATYPGLPGLLWTHEGPKGDPASYDNKLRWLMLYGLLRLLIRDQFLFKPSDPNIPPLGPSEELQRSLVHIINSLIIDALKLDDFASMVE
ncbi:uncharacterized protein BJ171DRAFT_580779 [Polychytrium aggregatum]|uniref:uncharacterized protein n=1 Tax=Polychytrium aggregatum TaxID=110093 RepID=UPI0022FEC8C4|nr:uncharacterized protein BJ171DRAFT_580779 [Polychytrium aggregatum]KAI9205603.1 hypothetical protein BJ171DRAFT_580779 [Polychytrium aggregatum]